MSSIFQTGATASVAVVLPAVGLVTSLVMKHTVFLLTKFVYVGVDFTYTTTWGVTL